jgi:hypothetical protein
MEAIVVKARVVVPILARLVLLALPLVLAACQNNGSGGSGY